MALCTPHHTLRHAAVRSIGGSICRLLFVISFAVLVLACAGMGQAPIHDSPFLSALAKAGPVPVPKENPHVASRQLLKEASEHTPAVSEFFREVGLPEVLEVEGRGLTRLYYPKLGQTFTLQKLLDTWVIDGPHRFAAVPIAGVDGKEASAIRSEKSAKRGEDSEGLWVHTFDLQGPRSEVRFNQRGDLLHTVEAALQSMEQVAQWYTGERKNASSLQRINQLDRDEQYLPPGKEILIPSYMLKRRDGMPVHTQE